MQLWQAALLVPAGVAAGLCGSIAGLASLVSYPALLGVGLAPVSANVTNTVALVFNSIGSVSASRPELTGQRDRAVRFGGAGVLGGIAGGALLLVAPAGSFEKVVPWLVALGSAAILVNRNPARSAGSRRVLPWVFVIGIYGGYFGAAAGVLMLALLLAALPEPLPRANALKNLVLGLANCVAAVVFAIFGAVNWAAAAPLAAGFLIGGRLGPVVVRHSPAPVLRVAIAVAGLGLAVWLGVDAYA